MRRTAVVLELTMPTAASSAMMAEIVSALVSPGTAIMSRPTEHTHVMASSLSSVRTPLLAAAIIPSSSDTGINAPDSPPTEPEAIRPPFLTASFKSARAAVVPCVPHVSSPISSRMRATLSPTAGVGARDKSTTPNGTPSRRDASCATSWPMRVMRKAVFLMHSATSPKGRPFTLCSAWYTTPGPDTPTLTTASASPTPWNAPAINGLSSTALQNTTSFAQPRPSRSFVSSAVFLIACPMSRTASMLIPAFVVATLTLEQTRSVSASACGMAAISRRSPEAMPFCTRAEKPPMKSTPQVFAALSIALANGTKSSVSHALATSAMGVTEMRLLTMGMPSSRSIWQPVVTRCSACRQILS